MYFTDDETALSFHAHLLAVCAGGDHEIRRLKGRLDELEEDLSL